MPEQPNPKFRPSVQLPAAPQASAAEYAELQVTSNFSFLRGGSHPEELIARAAETGCKAVAITDLNTMAGIVRAHEAAKQAGVRLVVGCHLVMDKDSQWKLKSNDEARRTKDESNSKEQHSKDKNARGPRERFDHSALDHSDLIRPSSFVIRHLELLLYPTDRAAYGRLCRLLTRGKRRAAKGHCDLALEDVLEHQDGLLAVLVPPPPTLVTGEFRATARRLREAFDCDHLSLAASCLYDGQDRDRLKQLQELARQLGAPLVATNDVHYHVPERRPLQDVLTCIRLGCTLSQAGFALFANAERHIKGPDEMARLFRHHPAAIRRTMEIAERTAGFSLDQLKYQYPSEICPPGKTMMQHLVDRTWEGARERYGGNDEIRRTNDESNSNDECQNDQNGRPFDHSNLEPSDLARPSSFVIRPSAGIPESVRERLAHELKLIEDLHYAPYFLTVDDIVRFARSQGILCQGRGAAANSAVCYCLGVTSVDPARIDLLVERFISKERDEPPDIDIDFEHERREEVIQYIYRKYGRDRAAITAEVITYRRRSAVREVGKALGLSLDCVDRLAKSGDWWDSDVLPDDRLKALGLDPHDFTLRQTIALAGELIGFPRHLSQHVGGFVISQEPLCEIVPVENAAMPDRTIIEWDKDDIDAMGMLKVDVLGLGMLTCIRKAIDLVNDEIRMTNDETFEPSAIEPSSLDSSFVIRHSSFPRPSSFPCPLQFHTIPPEDPAVYDMLCKADSVGVFQVESRAQMTMLPRLKPRKFYDLVIEVAIVRPGPIQGDMVHPYLRRRNCQEEISYPSQAVKTVLERTLGVPLFQEQAMRLVMVAAGFSAGEADQLRRAMAAWKRKGTLIDKFAEKIVRGMHANGYTPAYAQRVVQQIKGFSEYGFPESHAASFALLVYVSSWLKCHHPAAYAAALINSQPMGFYQPAQIIRDARDHGVEVRPIDVNFSGWDCTLENDEIRMTNDESNSKDQCSNVQNAPRSEHRFEHSSNRHSDLTRHSSFVIRHSPCRLGPALRLGLRLISGLRQHEAKKIADAVARHGPFSSIPALWRASGARAETLRRLASADAFGSLGLDRQAALWAARQLRDDALPMFEQTDIDEPAPELPTIPPHLRVVHDYAATGLSLKAHPVSFAREALRRRGVISAGELADERRFPHGCRAAVAGLVLVRQRPGTASGILFMTLEDETGVANLVVHPNTYERYRATLRHSVAIVAHGKIERQGQVIHLFVQQAEPLARTTPRPAHQPAIASVSRDFH